MIANLPWNMANTRSGTPLLPTVPSMLREEHEAGIPADPAAQDVRAEGQRVPDDDPDDADDRHRGEAVHHRAQDVLGPDEAAVEHRQAGHHQQHEGGGGEHPGRGAGVDRRLVGRAPPPSWRCRARSPGQHHQEPDGRHDGPDRFALGGNHPSSPPLAAARRPWAGAARRHGHGARLARRVPPGVRQRYGSAPGRPRTGCGRGRRQRVDGRDRVQRAGVAEWPPRRQALAVR